MKLRLDSAQAVLAPGEPWQVDVQGDYLYGAPAAGNRLLASFQVKRDRYALAQQWPGLVSATSAKTRCGTPKDCRQAGTKRRAGRGWRWGRKEGGGGGERKRGGEG